MLNTILANLYERDLRTLTEEVNQFKSEDDLWKTEGTIKNPSGNLVLHITGGLNHFFGATLAHNGYIRDRDLEFSKKGVKRTELLAGLEEVIPMVTQTLNALTQEEMQAEFPIIFDGEKRPTMYVLVRLLAHLDYHLGQVNYLRRMME
jgi:hypothetical protein